MMRVDWGLAVLLTTYSASPRAAYGQTEDAPPGLPASEPSAASGLVPIDELSMQDLLGMVTAVSKRPEKAVTAPATLTVVTRDDIVRNGWTEIAEILRAVPGLYVSSSRDHTYVGVRGVSLPQDLNTRVLVVLNGHTLNNPWSGGIDLADLLIVPVEAIERVEVIRGPSSSIYGSSAFFAVVHIETRDGAGPTAGGSGATMSLGASSLNRRRLAVQAHDSWSSGVRAGGYILALGGEGPAIAFSDMTRPGLNAPAPTPTNGRTEGTDFESGLNLGVHVAYGGLTLQGRFAHRVKGIPTARGNSIFNDPYNLVGDQASSVNVDFEREAGPFAFKLRAYLDSATSTEQLHRDPSDWPVGTWITDDPHTITRGSANRRGMEAQAVGNFGEIDTLIVGAELQWQSTSQRTWEILLQDGPAGARGDPDPRSIAGGVHDADGDIPRITPVLVGIYAQNEWNPYGWLSLVAGGRYDYNSLFTKATGAKAGATSSTAPRFAAVFRPTDSAAVKLLYGEAFRYPTIFEAYFDDAASVCGNVDIRPERVRTAEIAGTWATSPGFVLAASGFASLVHDLIAREVVTPCYAGSGARQQFRNQAQVSVYGGELAITVHAETGLSAFASATLAWTEQAARGERQPLANSPRVVAAAGLTQQLWDDHLSFAVQASAVSERYTWMLRDGDPVAHYFRIDTALSARRLFRGGLFASLRVTNLLGIAYRDPITGSDTPARAVPQPGLAVQGVVGHEW
jgi:outer membrane receptor for ferrienterochelin and colicins